MKTELEKKAQDIAKKIAKETADKILKTKPVSCEENIEFSNIEKGQYVARIEDGVAIPLDKGFLQGGYIKGGEFNPIGLAYHSEQEYFGCKETLKNGISKLEEMNNNAKITKTEDFK